jgi:hypothetical protein
MRVRRPPRRGNRGEDVEGVGEDVEELEEEA